MSQLTLGLCGAISACIGLIAITAAGAEKPIATLKGHSATVNALAFSPDGKTIASASSDKTIKLWDAVGSADKPRVSLAGHEEGVGGLAYSPDGKTLISSSSDKTIRIWDIATGKELAVLRGHEIGVSTLALSADGKLLATAAVNLRVSYRSEVKLWDIDAAQSKLRTALPDGHRVRSVCFSPDGKTMAYGSAEFLKLWDVAAGKELSSPKLRLFGSVNSVAYSPDGKTVFVAQGYVNRPASIVLWDLAAGKSRASIGKDLWGLGNFAVSPDGANLAVWTESYDPTTELKLFDPTDGKERAAVPTNGLMAAAFSPDGKRLVTAEHEAVIHVWNTPTGK